MRMARIVSMISVRRYSGVMPAAPCGTRTYVYTTAGASAGALSKPGGSARAILISQPPDAPDFASSRPKPILMRSDNLARYGRALRLQAKLAPSWRQRYFMQFLPRN